MPERPPEFVDLDIEESGNVDERHETESSIAAPPAGERDERDRRDDGDGYDERDRGDLPEEEQDAEADLEDEGDDVIGRAAAVLKYIVERIVDDPSQISIGATSDDRGPVLLLSVAEDDRGKVIGRQGRIVQAIRTIVKAATVGTGERVNVEIVD